MIIRIKKALTASGPSYSAFLVTDAGEANIVPSHESFYYVGTLAYRIKELLSVKTPENIKIEYPDMVTSQENEFEYQGTPTSVSISLEDISMEEVLGTHTTAKQRNKNKLPFDSAGTLAGIKLQARNVAERATLSDYEGFAQKMTTLVAQIADDVLTRQEEEAAKNEVHFCSHDDTPIKRSVEWLLFLLDGLGPVRFAERIKELANEGRL